MSKATISEREYWTMTIIPKQQLHESNASYAERITALLFHCERLSLVDAMFAFGRDLFVFFLQKRQESYRSNSSMWTFFGAKSAQAPTINSASNSAGPPTSTVSHIDMSAMDRTTLEGLKRACFCPASH